MQVWLDNTGLHSAGRALEGRAETEGDVAGLLQLVSLLVFSERLWVNGFEAEPIRERSRAIVSGLRELGLASESITVTEQDPAAYTDACVSAADAATQFVDFFNPLPEQLGNLRPDIRKSDLQPTRQFLDYAQPHALVPTLEEARDVLHQKRATWALSFMIASNEPLRRTVADTLESRGKAWTDYEIEQLNGYLRYYVNRELARQHEAIYAPALSRARVSRRQNLFALELLQKSLGDLASTLSGRPLGVPSILGPLVVSARGEPHALVREALAIRDRASGIRAELAALIRDADPLTAAGKVRTAKAVREWVATVEHQLRKPLALREALEVQFLLAVPMPSLSGAKVSEWYEHNRRARRLALLTELAAGAAYTDLQTEAYDLLRRRCLGHAA